MRKAKVTWLGQAGLMFDFDGFIVMVDPYLSDSCEIKLSKPENRRRIPVDKRFFDIQPDVLMFTHVHLDHYDPETAEVFLKKDKPMAVLCGANAWQEARKNGGPHNYVMMREGTIRHEGPVRFTAVPAEHSDYEAVGFVLEWENRKFYVTGDTLLSSRVIEAAPKNADAVFLPVNGTGNNMNGEDASCFVSLINARKAVPLHYGMMDNLNADVFRSSVRVVAEVYKEMEI